MARDLKLTLVNVSKWEANANGFVEEPTPVGSGEENALGWIGEDHDV
jgi:hypothetical protein